MLYWTLKRNLGKKGKLRYSVAVHSLGAWVLLHGCLLACSPNPLHLLPQIFLSTATLWATGYAWKKVFPFLYQQHICQNSFHLNYCLAEEGEDKYQLLCLDNCLFQISAKQKNISLRPLKVIDSGLQGRPEKFPHLSASNIWIRHPQLFSLHIICPSEVCGIRRWRRFCQEFATGVDQSQTDGEGGRT